MTWPLCSQCQFQRLDLLLKRENLQPKDFDVILGTLIAPHRAGAGDTQHACSPGVVLDGVCAAKAQNYKYLEVVERGAQHVQHLCLYQGCHYCCKSKQMQADLCAQCIYGKGLQQLLLHMIALKQKKSTISNKINLFNETLWGRIVCM